MLIYENIHLFDTGLLNFIIYFEWILYNGNLKHLLSESTEKEIESTEKEKLSSVRIIKYVYLWQFGVVVFNDKAQTLDGCYEKQLVPATSTTKKKFRDFLSSESGEGGADFDDFMKQE